jgi:hypothetical protein
MKRFSRDFMSPFPGQLHLPCGAARRHEPRGPTCCPRRETLSHVGSPDAKLSFSQHRRTVMKKATCGVVTLLALSMATRVVQADPVEGPSSHVDKVEAYATDVYRVAFYGGELARVRVIGDGDTDLDLYVLDENGHVIASDTGDTDICELVWQPLWTGPFTIRVVNLGGVYNRYVIRVD